MRSMRPYTPFMTAVRPSIRTSDWLHVRVCGSLQTKTSEPRFSRQE
jgi:hypothetical protein